MPKKKTTRNAQGAGTIRQRNDGRWEARYTLGHDSGTGKQIQKSVYGKTQKEARQKLQQICAAIDEGTYTEPEKMSLSNWLNIWLENYIGNVKPYTSRSYHDQVRLHITPALGSVKLTALNTHSIQAFYNNLQKGTDLKRGLSPKTIKNIHGVLHSALKQATVLGYIRFNPADAITLPRIEKPEIKPLQEDDIARFLQVIKGHRFETLYLVDLFTGMRQGEILGLTWDCVDFEDGTILINKQLQKEKKQGGKYVFVSNKNGKARRITPAPSIIMALWEHRRAQTESKLLAGPAWKESNLVFTNEFGEHLTHVTVYKNFKKLITQAGVPEARFHDMRHTYAVASLQAGDDIKTVQENLGHHAAAFTLDVYGHVTDRMKQASAQRMENFINEIKSCKG